MEALGLGIRDRAKASGYRPGDAAIIRELLTIDAAYRGREVEVLVERQHHPKFGPYYLVRPLGEVKTFFIQAHALRDLPPPNVKLPSWDECPFRPRGLA